MATRFQIILRDQVGIQVAIFTTWRTLEYSLRLNDVGSYRLEIDGDLPVISSFVLDGQVEIRRRDIDASPPIDWYTDFAGFHRTEGRRHDEIGASIYSSSGVDYKHLLARRAILFRDTTTGAEKTGPGETVMKAYVDENAGPGATAPPRVFAGVFPSFTVQPDGGAGDTWEGNKPYRPLLATLREIADATGVDFDVVATAPATFQFQAQAEPLGLDRTTTGLNPVTGLNAAGNAPLVFSLDYDNMGVPTYALHRIQEVTAAIVLGQGAEGNRVLVERTSGDIADSPWNRLEAVKNANQDEDTVALNARGDAFLQELQARETFTFAALQVPGTLYGRDYFIGDRVTARYQTIERNLQIVGITVRVVEGREDIVIEVSIVK